MLKELNLPVVALAEMTKLTTRRKSGFIQTLLGGLALLGLVCAGAHAATITTTITINGAGTSTAGAIAATGTTSFTGGLTGTGAFSSSFSLASAVSGTVPIALTVTTGSTTGTLTGTLSASVSLLAAVLVGTPGVSGPGAIAITSGTGGFAGTTGAFNVTASGAGAGTTGSGAGSFTLTGPGTLTTAGATGPTPPAVSALQNNYSYIPAGFPNYGIAPGSIFIIKGSGLADSTAQAALRSSAGPGGIPLTLNGASISVTVNGTTVHPGIYYAIASQIAAVLPAATPTGTGTLTVSYNTTPSATFPIQVVTAALGLGTYNGVAIATNFTTYALYSYTNSAKPGDTIVLWGSGLGAIPADSDTVYTSTPHASTGPLQFYIGGIPATPVYAGNSGYPGLDQIDVTVPSGVSPGCNVSLVAVSGSGANLVTSNMTAIPVSLTGGVCSDHIFGTDGTTTSTLGAKATVKTGAVILIHSISPGATAGTTQTNDIAESSFQSVSGGSYSTSGYRASLGSCALTQTVTGTAATGTTTGLDAGIISVSGPGGSATLTALAGGTAPGISLSQLTSGFIPTSGGAFTFKGTGGATVGSFTTAVNFPNPLLAWTNQSADSTISRASGATFNWTGGSTGSYVEITGTSTNTAAGISATYYCFAPVAAGTLTVPNAILLGLPSGTGTTSVTNATPFASFTATGLDFGFAYGFSQIGINSTYN